MGFNAVFKRRKHPNDQGDALEKLGGQTQLSAQQPQEPEPKRLTSKRLVSKVVSRSILFQGAAIVIALPLLLPRAAQAVAVRLGPLTFTEVAGDFSITGGAAGQDGAGNPLYTLNTVVTGPNIDLFTQINGLPGLDPFVGFRFRNVVTNQTGTPWSFFDHELQEIFRVQSPEADGLSFAQGIDFVRPFSSSRFTTVDETTDVRDFVNFSGGVVQPGQTVVFNYAITDFSPVNTFFLRQRPNFQVGGGGFFEPPAPPDPPDDPVVVDPPDPTPDPVPDPTPDPVPDPTPDPTPDPGSEPVPEPGSLLGLLLFGGLAATYRRLTQQT